MEAERFAVILLIIAVFAVFLFVKPETMSKTWEEQQALTARWVGAGTNTAAFDVVHGVIVRMYEWVHQRTYGIQDIAVNRWMAERLYVFVSWLSIVLYRAATLGYMTIYFAPIIAVAAFDGIMTREVRKTSFVAQSPLMHKIGLYTAKLFIAVGLVWLLLPYGVPAAAVPTAAALLALVVWAWAANLQKRI